MALKQIVRTGQANALGPTVDAQSRLPDILGWLGGEMDEIDLPELVLEDCHVKMGTDMVKFGVFPTRIRLHLKTT